MNEQFEHDLYQVLTEHYGENWSNVWDAEEDGYYLRIRVWSKKEEEDEEKDEEVNPTPKYRSDLIKDELRSDGVICDTNERVWVGAGDIIDWPQKGLEDRHPESDGYIDVLDETYNIVINVNGSDTYFRTIDLDWGE